MTSGQIYVNGSGIPISGSSTILTTGNVVANVPSGYAFAQTNMIVMWAGLIGSIPSGWHICDGTSGTPDLRDHFIVGGGGSFATSGPYTAATGATSAPADTLGTYTLTQADIPSHTHGNVIYAGSSGQVVGPTGTGAGSNYFFGGSGPGTAVNWNTGPNSGAGSNAHTHSVTPGAAHSHTQSIPYKAVFFIMKL